MDKVNAYLVTINDDSEIVGSWEEALELLRSEDLIAPAAADMSPDEVSHQVNNVNGGEVEIVPLTLDASFDHGRMAADELSMLLGQQAAYLVTWALAQGFSGKPFNPSMINGVDAAFTAATGIPTFAGWMENDDDAQALYEWSEEMQAGCSSAGWIVENSADAGMTWFYRPLPIVI